MLETAESRARLRDMLQHWPYDISSPVTVNQGLELLDMVDELSREKEKLEKKVNDQKSRIGRKVQRIEILEKNLTRLHEAYHGLNKEADWLAKFVGKHECIKGVPEITICPSMEACKNCWREGARKAVKEDRDRQEGSGE